MANKQRSTRKEKDEIAKKAQKLLKTKSVTEVAQELGMTRANLYITYIWGYNLTYRKNNRVTK